MAVRWLKTTESAGTTSDEANCLFHQTSILGVLYINHLPIADTLTRYSDTVQASFTSRWFHLEYSIHFWPRCSTSALPGRRFEEMHFHTLHSKANPSTEYTGPKAMVLSWPLSVLPA